MFNAAWVDINVFRRLEGQSKVAPLRHTFVVNQISNADIIGGDVAATGAAAGFT